MMVPFYGDTCAFKPGDTNDGITVYFPETNESSPSRWLIGSGEWLCNSQVDKREPVIIVLGPSYLEHTEERDTEAVEKQAAFIPEQHRSMPPFGGLRRPLVLSKTMPPESL